MKNDILAFLESMERDRGIERETLIKALEGALITASKKSANPAKDLRIEIDRKTYTIKATARMRVVERVQAPHEEISLAHAQRIKPDAKIGDFLEIEVPPRDFGRIAAQAAKQLLNNRLRQAERDKVYLEYKDRVGDIVSGTVRRFDRSDVILALEGAAEAVLPQKERVPTEEYQIGDKIRALVLDVTSDSSGTRIILSRSHPDFVKRLFELEVSEINDKTVEMRSIAREPGFRTKIAVFSRDEKVDPVGACVGMRGIRVKNIVRELSGEKIDIVRWNEDIKVFVTNALAPAKLTKVTVDEANRTVHVIVPPDQLSLAIGKKGQNARLTSKLTGWKIDIQKDESAIGFEEKVANAIAALAAIEGIGPVRAEKLVLSGFLTIEGLQAADMEDLLAIEGFTEEDARSVRAAVGADAPPASPNETAVDKT
jgi:N utilization substance protein A